MAAAPAMRAPTPADLPEPSTHPPATAAILPIHQNPQIRRLLGVGLLGAVVRWLEILAFGVFTYQQTGSAFLVASMTMLRMLPMGLFGVAFGAVAARISRRRGLLVSQGSLVVTNVALVLVSQAGALEIWHLAVASFINGTAWAGDNPMRRGLIGDIAGSLQMQRAMALDVLGNSACRLAGPALGGALLAFGGMHAVLVATAALQVAGFLATLGVARSPAPSRGPNATLRSILVRGFQAARESPRLASTLYITFLFNIFGWPTLSMVPVLGQERLALNARDIGLLASMDGVGSLLGAGLVIALARWPLHGHLYIGGAFVFFATLPVLALSVHPLLSAAALVVIGIGQSAFSVMQVTLAFISAPPDRRLEAMGLLTMCIGTAPIGFLTVGWLASQFGAPAALLTCSACGLLALLATRRWWRVCLHDGSRVPA
jgi:MFS family permease